MGGQEVLEPGFRNPSLLKLYASLQHSWPDTIKYHSGYSLTPHRRGRLTRSPLLPPWPESWLGSTPDPQSLRSLRLTANVSTQPYVGALLRTSGGTWGTQFNTPWSTGLLWPLYHLAPFFGTRDGGQINTTLPPPFLRSWRSLPCHLEAPVLADGRDDLTIRTLVPVTKWRSRGRGSSYGPRGISYELLLNSLVTFGNSPIWSSIPSYFLCPSLRLATQTLRECRVHCRLKWDLPSKWPVVTPSHSASSVTSISEPRNFSEYFCPHVRCVLTFYGRLSGQGHSECVQTL